MKRLSATLLLVLALPVTAQVPDEGTLSIRRDSREVGTETFRVTTSDSGLRITTRTLDTGTRPPTELATTLERTGTSGNLGFQLEYGGAAPGARLYAVQQGNRLTVRRVERNGEHASESPGGRGLVLLADSTFALFLQLVASPPDRPVPAVLVQGPRRLSLSVTRGPAAAAGGTRISWTGGTEGELLLGSRGELLRISVPALGLEAVRREE